MNFLKNNNLQLIYVSQPRICQSLNNAEFSKFASEIFRQTVQGSIIHDCLDITKNIFKQKILKMKRKNCY